MGKVKIIIFILTVNTLFTACKNDLSVDGVLDGPVTNPVLDETIGIELTFGDNIDLENLHNYEDQFIPNYIDEDNTNQNQISDEVATLGRVLFYDQKLSIDNSISCASCHIQENAFGDPARQSEGVNGITGRHSMRLVNARFSEERRFFWDERANTLEDQTTMPIEDHIEMGFSGENGDPSIADLIDKLEDELYYNELFAFAFGDTEITEVRMQNALAQFIRSIQSFDSRYDAGLAQVNNDNQNFPNFTAQENMGKQLFNGNANFQGNTGNRIGGGLGCESCHQAPEFGIDNNSDNNGVVNTAGDINGVDFTVERSPTLRDLFNASGILNSPLMHTGRMDENDMIEHYNNIIEGNNPNLDNRLARGNGQNLNMTDAEKAALLAFLKTLSGNDVYTNPKWSDPFIGA